MSGTKRIMVSVPNHLLQEVDGIVQNDRMNRSEFIRQAVKLYISERRKRFIRETMQRGYVEMGNINLQLSSEAFSAEEDADHVLGRLVKGV
ncbi:MAG: ndoAI [Bacilli bacterium]|nr:ndoAI [Bacilli bacterium]